MLCTMNGKTNSASTLSLGLGQVKQPMQQMMKANFASQRHTRYSLNCARDTDTYRIILL